MLSSIFFHFQTLNSSFIQSLFEEGGIQRGKTPAPQLLHFVCLSLQLGGKEVCQSILHGSVTPSAGKSMRLFAESHHDLSAVLSTLGLE